MLLQCQITNQLFCFLRRIAEAERILRERKEMENLRLREAERIAQLKMAAAVKKVYEHFVIIL